MHYSLYFCPIMDSDFSLSMGAAFVCNNKIRGGRSSRCNSDYAFPPFVFLSLFPSFALYRNAIYIVGADLWGTRYIWQNASRMKEGEQQSQLHRSATINDGCLPFSRLVRFRWATLRNWSRGRKGEEKRWKNRLNSLPSSLSAQSRCRLWDRRHYCISVKMQFIVSLYRRERALHGVALDAVLCDRFYFRSDALYTTPILIRAILFLSLTLFLCVK